MLQRAPGKFVRVQTRVATPSDRTIHSAPSIVLGTGTVLDSSRDAQNTQVTRVAVSGRHGTCVTKSAVRVISTVWAAILHPRRTVCFGGSLFFHPRFNAVGLTYDYFLEVGMSDRCGLGQRVAETDTKPLFRQTR
uniref:Uncharacterized protein n=1 Tax=Neobodo designis TaxID=312471 RepID=A0A7S1LNR5_NEODS